MKTDEEADTHARERERRREEAGVMLEIGAVSILPAGHINGMRADVIERLREVGFRGTMRWPGGCYAVVQQDWRFGLAHPDERPPCTSAGLDSYSRSRATSTPIHPLPLHWTAKAGPLLTP